MHPEVESALESGRAVVALETAIVTHGMPYPDNRDTATHLESLVRSNGATPATIALLDGKVKIGLAPQELERLAHPPSGSTPSVKVSRRDIAPALAFSRAGGTTVAGTMVLARSAGIDAFVTGGIGGVHRGAESSMDVSADLVELGRTAMLVVCAGAKSILDIPRTLEVLETHGVCVASYGGDDFPAFYTPSSGCKAPWRVDSVQQAGLLAYTGLTLPEAQATLLGVPIPAGYAEAGDAVQVLVEQAVRESVELGIDKRGKEVTPWLLKRVGELTKGSALRLSEWGEEERRGHADELPLDKALIENNVNVGTQVAVEIARLRRDASSAAYMPMPAIPSASAGAAGDIPPPATTATAAALPPPTVLVFGSAAIDLTSSTPSALVPRTTTPGRVSVSPGGVGRNIAEAAQALLPEHAVQLVSAVGAPPPGALSGGADLVPSDTFGQLLQLEMRGGGLRTDGLVAREGATAVCSLVLTGARGDLAGGVADMGIVEHVDAEMVCAVLYSWLPCLVTDTNTLLQVTEHITAIKPAMVVFDCNLTPATITAILTSCAAFSIPTFCDPTSTPKLARLVPALQAHPRALSHLSPNTLELDALYAALQDTASEDESAAAWSFINALNLGADWRASTEALANKTGPWLRSEGVVQKLVGCLPWVASFWVKAGEKGLLHLRLEEKKLAKGERWPGDAVVQHKTPDGRWLVLSWYKAPAMGEGEVVSTTGAGDTLAGGLVAGLVGQEGEGVGVAKALERVARTLRSHRAVG